MKHRSLQISRTRTLQLSGPDGWLKDRRPNCRCEVAKELECPAPCAKLGAARETWTKLSFKRLVKARPSRNAALRQEARFATHSPLTAPYPISFLHSRACSGLEETDIGGVTKFMTRDILTLEGGTSVARTFSCSEALNC